MGIAAIAQGSRITGQRHCYNLCESRAGLASLIVAARGYAFWVGLSVPQGGGGHRICRSDNPTIAAEESGAYWGTKAKPLASPKAGGFAVRAARVTRAASKLLDGGR